MRLLNWTDVATVVVTMIEEQVDLSGMSKGETYSIEKLVDRVFESVRSKELAIEHGKCNEDRAIHAAYPPESINDRIVGTAMQIKNMSVDLVDIKLTESLIKNQPKPYDRRYMQKRTKRKRK